jgi:hypothetical protein
VLIPALRTPLARSPVPSWEHLAGGCSGGGGGWSRARVALGAALAVAGGTAHVPSTRPLPPWAAAALEPAAAAAGADSAGQAAAKGGSAARAAAASSAAAGAECDHGPTAAAARALGGASPLAAAALGAGAGGLAAAHAYLHDWARLAPSAAAAAAAAAARAQSPPPPPQQQAWLAPRRTPGVPPRAGSLCARAPRASLAAGTVPSAPALLVPRAPSGEAARGVLTAPAAGSSAGPR